MFGKDCKEMKYIKGIIFGVLFWICFYTIGNTETIQDKYAASLTREIRKDEQIRELKKDNQNLGFWNFVWETSTVVIGVLYIVK